MSDHITHDIVLQILRFLPAKTLLRFRCVCSEWKQTIDSQSFILAHLSLQKPRLLVQYHEFVSLIVDPRKLPSFHSLIWPSSSVESAAKCSWWYHIIGTLHGIICLYNAYGRQLVLWNPWICKCLTIPSPFDFLCYTFSGYVNVVGTCAAFWIDPSTKAFKILGFTSDVAMDGGDDDADGCSLYSSITQVWKAIPFGKIRDFCILEANPQVVIDGVAYWRGIYQYDQGNLCNDIYLLLLFNFELERFDTIEAPCVGDDWDPPVLGTSEGALSLVYLDPAKNCNIFLRKQDSWVHTFAISLLPCVTRVHWAQLHMGEAAQKNSTIVATVNDQLAFVDTNRSWCYYLKTQFKDPDMLPGLVESLLFP